MNNHFNMKVVRFMTNYDFNEIALSETIDFTAFLKIYCIRIPPSALSKYGHLEIFPDARISVNTDCSTKSSTKYIFKLLCCCLPYRCIFVLFQIKDLLHCFCCIFFCIKFKMRISVGCCTEVTMSKPFLYLFHRYACSDEH